MTVKQIVQSLALVTLTTSGYCFGQVYKCTSRSGNIEFSNTACTTSSSGGRVKVEANTVDMSGSREQSLITENAELRQQLQNQQRALNDSGANRRGRTEADLQAERASSYECRVAKKKYEWETSAGMNGMHRDASAERLGMYAACGMREPAQVAPSHTSFSPPPVPAVITHCNGGFCYTNNGAVIPRVGR